MQYDSLAPNRSQRIIVGISGASGFQYGVKLLELLKPLSIESHLIISRAAHQVRAAETKYSSKEITALADKVHAYEDLGCAVSSGSYRTLGMIVAPCSMKSLAEIATGNTTNALSRAADVILKERRRLVLMTRETPLNRQHILNMLSVTEMGGIICPPVPAFYTRPESIDDIIFHSIARVLDLFDVSVQGVKRWKD
jgi:4-hydroxy-3-polyprenylbenzoate decarboxylase